MKNKIAFFYCFSSTGRERVTNILDAKFESTFCSTSRICNAILATFFDSLIMFLQARNNIYTPQPEKLKAIPIFILPCIEKPQYLALVFQLFHKDYHFHNFQGGQHDIRTNFETFFCYILKKIMYVRRHGELYSVGMQRSFVNNEYWVDRFSCCFHCDWCHFDGRMC